MMPTETVHGIPRKPRSFWQLLKTIFANADN
jgi:hypothetical protein